MIYPYQLPAVLIDRLVVANQKCSQEVWHTFQGEVLLQQQKEFSTKFRSATDLLLFEIQYFSLHFGDLDKSNAVIHWNPPSRQASRHVKEIGLHTHTWNTLAYWGTARERTTCSYSRYYLLLYYLLCVRSSTYLNLEMQELVKDKMYRLNL